MHIKCKHFAPRLHRVCLMILLHFFPLVKQVVVCRALAVPPSDEKSFNPMTPASKKDEIEQC